MAVYGAEPGNWVQAEAASHGWCVVSKARDVQLRPQKTRLGRAVVVGVTL